jgi:hypothetical protein
MLRGEDLDLQNRMIKFSQFLQDNEKKKTDADIKKNEESKVNFIFANISLENRRFAALDRQKEGVVHDTAR